MARRREIVGAVDGNESGSIDRLGDYGLPGQAAWQDTPVVRTRPPGRWLGRFLVAWIALEIAWALVSTHVGRSADLMVNLSLIAPAFAFGSGVERATRRDEALLEDPEDSRTVLGTITIFQNGVPTGTDTGAMYVDDGFFVFSGRKTSFRIGGQDLMVEPEAKKNLHYRAQAADGMGFALRHPSRFVWVKVTPLERSGEKTVLARIHFSEAFRHWRANRPRAAESSQYPPLTVSPDMEVARRAQPAEVLRACSFELFFVMVGAAQMLVGHPYLGGALVFVSACVGIGEARNVIGRHRTGHNRGLLRVMQEEGQTQRLAELGYAGEPK